MFLFFPCYLTLDLSFRQELIQMELIHLYLKIIIIINNVIIIIIIIIIIICRRIVVEVVVVAEVVILVSIYFSFIKLFVAFPRINAK